MNRETRIGVALVVALGAFVFFMLVVGSLGGVNPDLQRFQAADVVREGDQAARYGTAEVRIVGWYAELAGDCVGGDGGADASIAWLQRDCPLRVLLPQQPAENVTQAELARSGQRLAATTGGPFPSRARPDGPNLRLEQLVFIGHFDDAAARSCVPDRVDRCRNTFVVSTYSGLLR